MNAVTGSRKAIVSMETVAPFVMRTKIVASTKVKMINKLKRVTINRESGVAHPVAIDCPVEDREEHLDIRHVSPILEALGTDLLGKEAGIKVRERTAAPVEVERNNSEAVVPQGRKDAMSAVTI